MRTPKYLSPSGISLYEEDPAKFYLVYLSDNRPDKMPQTEPMAIGSAFDAFVKSYLYQQVYGAGKDARYELMALFEAQVESPRRDKAYEHGKHVFEQYKAAGCLADLMLELKDAATPPKFEFEVFGQVEGRREGAERQLGAIPFLGKPDVYFTNKAGVRVIPDFKVNGFYSAYRRSPTPGYISLCDTKQRYGAHKGAMVQMWQGTRINIAHNLEMFEKSWARQLAIYAWLVGEPVGSQMFVAGIEQVVCCPDTVRPLPEIKFAKHRLRIGKEFQYEVFNKAAAIWDRVTSDHFFRELPLRESQMKCETLDKMSEKMKEPPKDDNDVWFKAMMDKNRG
jgi:hypothetical protein